VMQRYREYHDFFYTLTGLPSMVEGKVALKVFELANTLLPMTGLSFCDDETEARWNEEGFYNIWALSNQEWVGE
jgi:Coenzyme Q (ubiquinone) biosynthesis protein Coq4